MTKDYNKVLGVMLTRLAKTLGITRDAVHKWKKYPPIDKQFQIMVLSGGRLAGPKIIQKRLKQMNKYKIAMSVVKDSALLKLSKRLGLILLVNYLSTLRD